MHLSWFCKQTLIMQSSVAVITCTIFWSVITYKESRFFLFCLYWLMIIMTSLLTKVTLKTAGSLTGKAIMKPSELCLLTAALSSQSAVRLVGGLQTTTTPTRAQLHRPIDQKQQISPYTPSATMCIIISKYLSKLHIHIKHSVS